MASTTAPTAVNLSLLELLLCASTSGKLPVILLQVSQPGGTSQQAHALFNSARNPKATTNRASGRGSIRVCLLCGTSATIQRRRGPDGTTSLCNACGQRYHRQKAAEERQKAQRQLHHQKHRTLMPTTVSPSFTSVSCPLHPCHQAIRAQRRPIRSTSPGGESYKCAVSSPMISGCQVDISAFPSKRSTIYSLLN